jgi:hypothetical protein
MGPTCADTEPRQPASNDSNWLAEWPHLSITYLKSGRDGGIRTRGLLLPKQNRRSFNLLDYGLILVFLQLGAI